MSEQINAFLSDMEYDYQLGRPVRYSNAMVSMAKVLPSLGKEKQEEFSMALDTAMTSEILFFGDQLSKEAAEELKNIRNGLQELVTVTIEPNTEELTESKGKSM
ncbi:MAG: hypothetical protein IJ565_04730 [Bacilli bacterium]|nr:hypothetical protein [Bacilli bacterium]